MERGDLLNIYAEYLVTLLLPKTYRRHLRQS